MKKLSVVLLFAVLLSTLFSCAKEEDFPVTADFSIKIINDDYSVPVRVEIKNSSTGADRYEWSFEGANVESSTNKNPPIITYSQAGKYTLTLKASNRDGEIDEKSIEIELDEAMKVDFDWQMIGSDIAPVTLQMVANTEGAISYKWEFDGGNPLTSTNKNPKVSFVTAGKHTIKLTISNGRETYSTTKTITVKDGMIADFDWTVDLIDNDMEAPVKLYLRNKSSAAVSYQWSLPGANPSQSTETNPVIVFASPGTYEITLSATNDKETKKIVKQVTVHPNKNLLSFSNIKLGINTAHTSIGSFFSSHLGKVISKNEVSKENGQLIDIVYFGLDSNFSQNQFLSPDKAQTTAFAAIPNAISEKIINSQEKGTIQLTPAQFESIRLGSDFNNVSIEESSQGSLPFNSTKTPRVVLIQTADGRKGAVKVNSFVTNGKDSYILVDIKIQKTK